MNQPVRTSGTAVASLVCGILAWLMLPVLGALAAVICGHVARSQIRREPPGSIDGDGLAIAGLMLGYVQLALGALLIIGIIMLVMFGLSVGAWH